VNYRLIATG